MARRQSLRQAFMVIAAIAVASVPLYLLLPFGKLNDTVVVIDTTGLRDGDLLFRKGNGEESRLVTGLSNGVYSHIAMAYNDNGNWMAVHAVPGETENRSDTDYLKSEPLEVFYCPERAQNGGRARIHCSDSIARQALAFALDKVERRFAFDHKYSLSDTTEYYCTELIYHAYLTQGIDLADDRSTSLPIPGTADAYIFPSDLLASPRIEDYRPLRTITKHYEP